MPNKIIKIKPVIAVICDDIRKEDNGKPIIIGVYQGDIKINIPPVQGPHVITLSLWIPFTISEAGQVEIELKISGPNPENQMKMKAHASFEKAPSKHDMPSFNITGFPLVIENGVLEIFFRNKGDNKWTLLRSASVSSVTMGSST